MTIDAVLDVSLRWRAVYLKGNIEVRVQQDAPKAHLAAISIMSLCLEYHQATLLLVQHGRLAAASVFLRPMLEATLRGIWLFFDGQSDAAKAFMEGENKGPQIPQLLNAISQRAINSHSILAEIYGELGNDDMNNYTHGGQQQFAARMQADAVASQIPEDSAARLCHFADLCTLLAAEIIARACEDEARAAEYQAKFRKLHLLPENRLRNDG